MPLRLPSRTRSQCSLIAVALVKLPLRFSGGASGTEIYNEFQRILNNSHQHDKGIHMKRFSFSSYILMGNNVSTRKCQQLERLSNAYLM